MNNKYKLYSIKEVSENFGIKEAMLRKLVLNNKINYVKVGSKIHFTEETIINYINDRTVYNTSRPIKKVVVDLSECDLNEFAGVIHHDKSFTWVFDSKDGEPIEIEFVATKEDN